MYKRHNRAFTKIITIIAAVTTNKLKENSTTHCNDQEEIREF
jgi:hypothetical protein